MADPAHVAIFEQGVAAWNRWRSLHRSIRPDLSGAELKAASFRGANLNAVDLADADLGEANLERAYLEGVAAAGVVLRRTHLFGADLGHADLDRADLRDAQLWHVRLGRATLRGARLGGADLRFAELGAADLSGAELDGANLAGCELRGTDLRAARLLRANLQGATFHAALLAGADFAGARVALTVFADVDLAGVAGLGGVLHARPSTIGVDTLLRTAASLPVDPGARGEVESFLRHAGVPEPYLALFQAQCGRTTARRAFLVFSQADRELAHRLLDALLVAGVRCWPREYPMLPGDPDEGGVDLGAPRGDATILACSPASLHGWWLDGELAAGDGREVLPVLFADSGAGGAEAVRLRIGAAPVADFSRIEAGPRFERETERLVGLLRGA